MNNIDENNFEKKSSTSAETSAFSNIDNEHNLLDETYLSILSISSLLRICDAIGIKYKVHDDFYEYADRISLVNTIIAEATFDISDFRQIVSSLQVKGKLKYGRLAFDLKLMKSRSSALSDNSLYMRPIELRDIELLFEWRNKKAFLDAVTKNQEALPIVEFVDELTRNFTFDRHDQMIINNCHGKAIGTIFSYSFDEYAKNTFISIFIDNKQDFVGLGAKAVLLYADHLLSHFGIKKIYMDVYASNISVVNMLDNLGVEKEGRFIKFRFMNDEYVDVIRYGLEGSLLYESNFRLRPLTEKLGILENSRP